MLINDLKIRPKKKKKTIGRGGVHGTYSTRGGKGQTARSGSSFYLGFEGGKSGLKKQLHKLGGFKSIYAKPQIVKLDSLNQFKDRDVITKKVLAEKNIIRDTANNVKILGGGNINRKLLIKKILISDSAKRKIEEAGGIVQ